MAENVNHENNIGAKLRELRLLKGIKKIEVLVGRANQGVTNEDDMLTTPYVYRLESGSVKSPGLEVLSRYAKGLNMTVGELTDYITGAKKINGVHALSTMSELANAMMVLDERFGTVKLPVIGHVPTKETLDVDKNISWVYIPRAMITDTLKKTMDNWRVVVADDDSLVSEDVYPGYFIVYDPLNREIVNGKMYMVRVGGESYAAVLSKLDEQLISVRHFDKETHVPEWDVEVFGRIRCWGFWKSDEK